MHLPLAIAIDGDVEFGGGLQFRWCAVQPLLHSGDRSLNLLGALALLARRPIQTAQAVQHPSFDLERGVSFELGTPRGIAAIDRQDETHHSGGYQIVQAHILGQAAMKLAR